MKELLIHIYRAVLELYTKERLWSLSSKEPQQVHQWMFAIQLVQEKSINTFDDLLGVQDAIGSLQETIEVRNIIRLFSYF